MLPTLAMGAMSGGTTSAFSMGIPFIMTQATGNSYTQARNEGATHEQALKYGLGSGLLEGGVEMLVGGLPGMKGVIDPLIDSVTKKVKSKIVKKSFEFRIRWIRRSCRGRE